MSYRLVGSNEFSDVAELILGRIMNRVGVLNVYAEDWVRRPRATRIERITVV